MNNRTEANVDESTRIGVGLYRYVDMKQGYVVYQSVYDGETTGVSAVPIREEYHNE